MTVFIRTRDGLCPEFGGHGKNLFASPKPAGRKITTCFAYLQRIGKSGTCDVWFPDDRFQPPHGENRFAAHWAAIRQFELLHESGNHKIYDLDPERLERATLDLSRSMRAGGYRVTVAMIGRYEETSPGDELEILDLHLQESISQMIHMLYLERESDIANRHNTGRLASNEWDYRTDLPHIGMVLGAWDVFRPENQRPKAQKLGRLFFEMLSKLPHKHVVHDTAIGLQLPELNGENQWNYIASPEETLAAFNHVLCSLFDKFNALSLSRLHERADAHNEIKSSVMHLRGYGDRINDTCESFYHRCACALN